PLAACRARGGTSGAARQARPAPHPCDEEKPMPAYQYLTYELVDDGTIARIKLNRPAARNAQNRGMLVELGDAMLAAEADDQVRVVILGGAGPLFSADHDLGSADAVAERTAGPDLHATYSQYGATRSGAEKRTLQEWHFY